MTIFIHDEDSNEIATAAVEEDTAEALEDAFVKLFCEEGSADFDEEDVVRLSTPVGVVTPQDELADESGNDTEQPETDETQP